MTTKAMRKVIQERLRREAEGLSVLADLNAVVSVNGGDGGPDAGARSHQKVVHRSKRRAGAAGAGKRGKEAR